MNPFDIVGDINSSKKGLINETNEKDYNAWIVNKAFSYFPDTILHSQEMNTKAHLDNKMQHDYLIGAVRKGKRFTKWAKKDKDEDTLAVQEFFSYNREKAKTALTILSKDQLKAIKRELKVAKEF
jgi:hypothetical protein